MLEHVAACCHVHRHRFPYLSGPCVACFPICLATCLPSSTSIDICFRICLGDVWAGEAGPNCGQELFPCGPGRLVPVGLGRLVPVVVVRLVPVEPGRVIPVGPGTLAPAVAGRLVPVVQGRLVPVGPGRLVPVSKEAGACPWAVAGEAGPN